MHNSMLLSARSHADCDVCKATANDTVRRFMRWHQNISCTPQTIWTARARQIRPQRSGIKSTFQQRMWRVMLQLNIALSSLTSRRRSTLLKDLTSPPAAGVHCSSLDEELEDWHWLIDRQTDSASVTNLLRRRHDVRRVEYQHICTLFITGRGTRRLTDRQTNWLTDSASVTNLLRRRHDVRRVEYQHIDRAL